MLPTYQQTTVTHRHNDTTRSTSGVIFIPLLSGQASSPYSEMALAILLTSGLLGRV